MAQKNITRILEELRRNVTTVLGSFAFDLDMLSMRLNFLHPSVPALTDGSEDTCEARSEENDTCQASPGSFTHSDRKPEVHTPCTLAALQFHLLFVMQQVTITIL